MYENVTFESIMEKLLAQVSSLMDKREGSVIWDALAPAAVELQNMYIQLDVILKETFADTASLFYLKKRAAERGIYQRLATCAVIKGTCAAPIPITEGTRFSSSDVNYVVTKVLNGNWVDTEYGPTYVMEYELICETAGTVGNKTSGSLIPIEYDIYRRQIEITELLIPAQDEEDVEELRERYLSSMTSQAYGGNIADYKEKTIAVDGVGGVKVTPVWNGGGTVKLTIINNLFEVPSTDLIAKVKNEADPYPHEGLGYGFAPIGHVVTVKGVTALPINIVTNITYKTDWNWESAKSYILKAVDDYFKEAAKQWEESDNLVIRISHLESKILDCAGVMDITGTTLNGTASNLTLAENQIPVRGTVNGN